MILHHHLLQVIEENVIVKDHRGNEIESQFVPLPNASLAIRNYYSMAYLGKSPSVTPKYWLAFSASAPPLGLNTYFISSGKRKGSIYHCYSPKIILLKTM